MARYIFTPPNVSSSGQRRRLTFYDRLVGGQRLTDLYTIDGSDNLVTPIPNGLITTTEAGVPVVAAFSGPSDIATVFMQIDESPSRLTLIQVRASAAPSAAFVTTTTYVDARAYGVVADDTTDNRAGLISAMASAATTGGTVYVPPGSVRISNTINVPNKVVLKGANRDLSKIKAMAGFTSTNPLVRLGSGSGIVFGCRVEDLSLDGNSAVDTCLYTTEAQEQCGARRVVIENFSVSGAWFDSGTANVHVADCEFYPKAAGATYGIRFVNAQGANLVDKITVGVSGLLTSGLYSDSASTVTATGIHVENCTNGVDFAGEGVVIGVTGPTGIANVTNLVRMRNTSRYCAAHGITKNLATNAVLDDFNAKTITAAYVPSINFGDDYSARLTHYGDRVGFYGTTPIAIQTAAANATDLATAITLVNGLKTQLKALGLLQ